MAKEDFMKKRILRSLIIALGLLTVTAVAWVGNCPNLPSESVTPTVTKYGTTSYFDISFSDIPDGYDVANGIVYKGWCVDPYGDITGDDVYLICTAGTVPSDARFIPWDKVNYLLNHKIVGDPVTFGDMMAVQYALWYLVAGGTDPWTGFSSSPFWTANAQAMYADANANGAGFTPGPGEIVAVLLYQTTGFSFAYHTPQDMIIELVVPPNNYEGCTPGYWKNHLNNWPAPYAPTDSFSDTFGVVLQKDVTLQQALNLGGGGFNMIARHGVAALLSAAHSGVAYPYSIEAVISAVQDALAGNKDAIKALAAANELGCPLGN